MRITYLNSASVLIEDKNVKILCDPWLDGEEYFGDYPEDFFDFVIVDECHRGSARDDSNWREILEWFKPAYQLGMTATPLHEDNRDIYRYLHDPDMKFCPVKNDKDQ